MRTVRRAYRGEMLWQVTRRSLVGLAILGGMFGLCVLLALVLPDALAKVLVLGLVVSVFGVVIVLIGWIFQGGQSTDPPRSPGRRLRAVADVDEGSGRPDQRIPVAPAEPRRAA
jgi:hypothetical protein